MPVRILVVEDDPANRRLLSLQLADLGEVDVASNGRDAIEALGRATPDLLVLDLRMPGLDGFAIVRWLREQGSKCPTAAITAMELSPAQVDFLSAEPVALLLEKGQYSTDELVRRLRPLLGAALT